MQLGLGIDDGKLYISLPRPMPSSQLGDTSRWTVDGFNAEKQNIEVLAGNDTVVIELSERRTLDDPQWLPSLLISPRVSFNSSLGIMNAYLFPDRRPGQAYDKRSGQVYGCEKGTVYPLGSCNEADDWDLDRTHLTSEGKERREILNAEAYTILEGCGWGGGTPWGNCLNYAVSQFNWALEGHLDPQTNWEAQYDTLDYSSTQRGYYGVGFSYGHWQHYERNKGYFVPSTCRYRWESRVDCNNCDGSEPYGYESKGFRVGDDTEIETDTTCPVFDNEDGIVILPGEELNDYVQNTLIPELNGMGVAYAADGTSNLWSYYWSRCGNGMDEWLQANPGGLCVVVRAKDETSDEGQWIHHYLSIDFEDDGVRNYQEDVQLHYFYVDIDPYANTELTEENWPRGANCNSPLPTDGYRNGEYSVWILRTGCSWLNWSSGKLRIKDDCHNWRRSGNLAPGVNMDVIITSPGNNTPVTDGESVTFIAQISGNPTGQELAELIKWSVYIEENGQWHNYGPHEPPPFNNWADKVYSVISPNEDWTGPNFKIDEFRDCELTVRARLDACNTVYDDYCRVFWVAGERGGQAQSRCGTGEIVLQVEPGIIRSSDRDNTYYIALSSNAPPGQDIVEIYWIDGPSIPIFITNNEGGWHTESLENVLTNPNITTVNDDYISPFTPVWANMKVGQIQIRICVPRRLENGQYKYDYDLYEVYVIKPDQTIESIATVELDENFNNNCADCPYVEDPIYVTRSATVTHIWDINNSQRGGEGQNPILNCGYYQIRVEGRDEGQVRGESYVAYRQYEVYLDKVKPFDVLLVAPIYTGDGYLLGGHRPPHHETDDDECSGREGTVDCSGYLTQLLRRLARKEGNTYPINHIGAVAWRTSSRAETLTSFAELQAGDLIVWGHHLRLNENNEEVEDGNHIGIFYDWNTTDGSGHNPVKGVYVALVWQSWGDCDSTTNKGQVQLKSTRLRTEAEYNALKTNENPYPPQKWHMPRRFVNNIVFNSCQQ